MAERHSKILYVLNWFPAISEIFILREILELQKLGEEIDVFPLKPSPDKIHHHEFSFFRGKIFQQPDELIRDITSHLYWIIKKPGLYFGILVQITGKIRHLKTFTVSMRIFHKAVRAAYYLKKENYRHIHAHFGNAPATGAWIISCMLDIPFSFTTHAIDIFIPDMLLETKINDAQFVVTISNFNKNHLKTKFPSIKPIKIHVIRCGVNPDEFVFESPAAPKIPCKIASVGRLVEKKGFEFLLKAAHTLIRTGRTIELVIIGGGERLKELKNLADQLDISHVTKFIGPQPNHEVLRIMRESDLFVLACVEDSRGDMDGIPVALMESLALGIPSISTEISGIPELIKPFQTGLLVPPKDTPALADAIRLLLADKDLRNRLAQAGRKLIMEEFDISKNAMQLLDLIGRKK